MKGENPYVRSVLRLRKNDANLNVLNFELDRYKLLYKETF